MIKFIKRVPYIHCDKCLKSHNDVKIYGFKDNNFRKEDDICAKCVDECDDLVLEDSGDGLMQILIRCPDCFEFRASIYSFALDEDQKMCQLCVHKYHYTLVDINNDKRLWIVPRVNNGKNKTFDKQLKLRNIWLDQITVENDYQFSYEKLEELTGVPKGTIGRYSRDYGWQEARADKLKTMMISVSTGVVTPLDDDAMVEVVTLVQNQKLTYNGYAVLETFVKKILAQVNPSAKDVKLVMEIVKLTSDRDDRFRDALAGSNKSFDEILLGMDDIEIEG